MEAINREKKKSIPAVSKHLMLCKIALNQFTT